MKIKTLDLHFQNRPQAIAAFLVEGPEGAVLIETGPESCRETLMNGLAELGHSPETIAAVFVTHIHLDHAGGAGWWAEQGIPLYVHPKGARHLIDPTRLEESARQVYGERFDELWGAMVAAPAEKVIPLEDGESVAVAGIEIEALETPGHCFHHHAYRIGSTIFSGDSAGAKLDASDFISVTSAPPQFHLEHTLASIEKLKALEPEALYLTHFGKVENPAAHLEAYKDVVDLNAFFVKQRLDEGMDPESLHIAYEAFQMEQAFRAQVPSPIWETLQEVNGTAMCADGIRLYWEKSANDRA